MGKVINNTLGKIRNSVGQNNFYVRAGVQVVRLKPSFTPDRTFTLLQTKQQYKLKAVRKVLQDAGFEDWVNCINTGNNKKYNASSKYNRITGLMLKNIRNVPSAIEDADYTIEEFIQEYLYDMASKFSIGNIPNIVNSYSLSWVSSKYRLRLGVSQNALQKGLQIANRRRSPEYYYTDNHVYVIGWFLSPDMAGGGVFFNQLATIVDGSDSPQGSDLPPYYIDIDLNISQLESGSICGLSVANYLLNTSVDLKQNETPYSNNSSNNNYFTWML